MSIKFKQNGQWVKIPTPSQIDDSATSAVTTYSSNKINEIIPQDIAKYLLEHKDELGTDDFTKLKNVPFTTINTTNKSEFTTLKGILNHPDGMYLVDDCGVTNGDAQLTIASFKGHCSTLLMQSIAQFQEITDSIEIQCYRGSVIYIQTDGDISDSSATRYVSIYNVPMGVIGEPSDLNRTYPDAEASIVNIEIYPVVDSSNAPVTYSYDIDGGTKTYFTNPAYESMLNSMATSLVAGGMMTGKSSYSSGQLIQVVNDTDSWSGGSRFTGVDASEFKSPFTLITNENATNYNTLDKLCHLDDGLYLCKDTYKANQDYIVDITFKGINYENIPIASFTGTPPTPDEEGNTKCKNGAIISVVTQTGSTKNKIIRITHGLSAKMDMNFGKGFEDIYIVAEPDDSTASTLVYGVTGSNVKYYRPFSVMAIYSSLIPFAAMNNSLMGNTINGTKMAVWNRPEGSDMPTLGFADIPTSSPIIEINDSNWSNFDTLQKWMINASAGTYLVKTTKLTVSAEGVDQTKSSDNSFSRTLNIPSDTYVYVYSTDDSNSSATNYKNVVFQKADNMPSAYYGEWMTFKWDTRHIYSADNVELYPLMTAAINGAAAIDVVMEVLNLFADISASDVGKVVKIASGADADSYKFQATDITLIGNSTAITPAQVLAAVNEGKTTTITHTDATHGTFKFTSFGVISTASGDAVSSSITYGTSADSLVLHTLIGDVTNGTWTLYSKNLTVSA